MNKKFSNPSLTKENKQNLHNTQRKEPNATAVFVCAEIRKELNFIISIYHGEKDNIFATKLKVIPGTKSHISSS